MELSDLHFIRPWWLLLLVLGLLLLWPREKSHKNSPWNNIIDEHLAPHILVATEAVSRTWGRFFLGAYLILVTLALAGPTIKKIPSQSEFLRKPLIIALDMSEHMLSKDISPSRLKRAKYKIKDLLSLEKGRDVALIAFAGDAHTVVPFTNDYKTFFNLLDALEPSLMPVMGANLGQAIKEAQKMAKPGVGSDMLIITSTNISDKNELKNVIAGSSDLDLYLWSFATKTGAPLIEANGQFARSDGSIALSMLDEKWIKKMNDDYGVLNTEFSPQNNDLKILSSAMAKKDRVVTGRAQKGFDTWYDLGPYFLLAAMAIFFISVLRKNVAGFLVLGLIILPSLDVKASFLNDLFLRKDQQAHRALIAGDPKKAAELYDDDFSKGTAYYKAKNYEEALKHLSQVHTADGYYNLGNTLAQLGNLDQAIKAYDEALKIKNDHEDAKYNKELLEKQKKEQEQKQNSDQENKEQNNDQNQNQGENKQDGQNDQNKNEQNSDDKKSEKNQSDQENKQSNDSKNEQEKNEQKEDSKSPEQPKNEQEPKEQNQTQKSLNKDELGPKPKDQNTRHAFEHLEQHNNQFLKRKFLFESRTKNRKQP